MIKIFRVIESVNYGKTVFQQKQIHVSMNILL